MPEVPQQEMTELRQLEMDTVKLITSPLVPNQVKVTLQRAVSVLADLDQRLTDLEGRLPV